MKEKYFLYKVDFTEYEQGWGSRPDDFILAKTADIANSMINHVETHGSYKEYSRANFKPIVYEVSEEIYNLVNEKESGWTWFFAGDRAKYKIGYGKISPFAK